MRGWFGLGLLLGSLTLAGGARASEIVILGDSWGVLFEPSVRSTLDAEGFASLGITNLAIGGTTSASWAAGAHGDLGLLLGGHPDLEIVHVSLGGNDLLGGLADPFAAIQQAVADTLSVLSDVVAATAADVLITGYDYLPVSFGGLPAGAINLFLDSYVNAVADGVAADSSLASQVTVLNTHGLMQIHFGVPQNGIPAFDPSLPNSNLPGPTTAFADAIHLTPAGYDVYAQEVFDLFYASALVPEPAVASLAGMVAVAFLVRRRAA